MIKSAERWLGNCAGMAILAVFILGTGTALADKPAVISVVLDDNYPPYVFRNADGVVQGILPDQWALWQKKTGVKATLHAMDWVVAQQEMAQGRHQVIDTIFHTPERARIYNFSKPYADLPVPIFFHKELSGITDAESLQGFAVGVKKGDACIDFLRQKGVAYFDEYDSYEAMIRAAAEESLRVFVMDAPPAYYYLNKYRIADHFKQSEPLYVGQFHRAAAKGRRDLIEAVEDGFAEISASEYEAIRRKWMGTPTVGMLAPVVFRSLGIAALVALVIFTMLLAWNHLLKRTVRKRTGELDHALRELRQSEAYLSAIFNQVNDAIFIHDGQGRIIDLNRRACDMFGYTREEMLNRQSDAVSREEAASQEQVLKEMRLAREQGPRIFEREMAHKNGTSLHIEHNIVYTRINDDDRYVVAARDITARKQMESEKLEIQRQLLHAQKLESLGILAGGIAHDFNNLLTAIHGNLELATMDLPPHAASGESNEQAIRATNRATELTRQLLAYSGRGVRAIAPVDLSAVVKDNARILRTAIPRSISLDMHLSEHLPLVDADISLIQQVVMNLITNAAEAIGDRPGVITLTTGSQVYTMDALQRSRLDLAPSPGLFVYLETEDNGIGMDEATIQRIFDPFFTTKSNGRGLGMSAVMGAVSGHHGAIFVDSSPGQGTRIRALFPASQEHYAAPEAGPLQALPGVSSILHPFPHGAVLVVDDEPDIRSLCVRLLDRLGLLALTAGDGRRAISMYQAHRDEITCVLLDLTMPNMDGVETHRELRKLDPDLPIIMVSGHNENEITERFAGQPVPPTISKPFQLDELKAMLERVLQPADVKPV